MPDNNQSRLVPPWKKKEPLEHQKMNKSVTALNRLIGGVKLPQQVRRVGNPTLGIGMQLFKLVAVFDDYVTANPWNGSSADTTSVVKIAKPYLLRNAVTSRGGISYTYSNFVTRTASQGSNSETQIVIPTYVAGDIIEAAKLQGGNTGVTAAPDWQDQNIDGRAWAKQ